MEEENNLNGLNIIIFFGRATMACNDVTPTPSSIFVNFFTVDILMSETPSSSISCAGICNTLFRAGEIIKSYQL